MMRDVRNWGSLLDCAAIKGITADSRLVKPGYVFAALPGVKADGHSFIPQAVSAGAVVVLVSNAFKGDAGGAQVIACDDLRCALSELAAWYYEDQPEHIVAVTGTNGKTSTVYFVEQFWRALGKTAASLGTLGWRAPNDVALPEMAMTTPDPVVLHEGLARLSRAGVTHLAMEASSHGLDQYRLHGVRLRAAGFTNLTRDHLDYHGSMEEYGAAKLKLFSEVLVEGGVSVVNADDPFFEKICETVENLPSRLVTYGHAGEDLRIISVRPEPQGLSADLSFYGQEVSVNIPLVGAFQLFNVLCAAGLVLGAEPTKNEIETIVNAMQGLTSVPGRMQLVAGHPAGAGVYVDYAHTPDALETVLKALRAHTSGRLVCLFGCGGDRDTGKRPMMGRVADDLADHVIVTDDNPRSENPADIRAQILAAVPEAQDVGGRASAIKAGVSMLSKGDVLCIAGKGHEQGQIFADHTEPFDDCQVAAAAIAKCAGGVQ